MGARRQPVSNNPPSVQLFPCGPPNAGPSNFVKAYSYLEFPFTHFISSSGPCFRCTSHPCPSDYQHIIRHAIVFCHNLL